jgi:hypothetical protein
MTDIHPLDSTAHDHLVIAEFREGQLPNIRVVPETQMGELARINGHLLAATRLVPLRIALEMFELLRAKDIPAGDFQAAKIKTTQLFQQALEDASCSGN